MSLYNIFNNTASNIAEKCASLPFYNQTFYNWAERSFLKDCVDTVANKTEDHINHINKIRSDAFEFCCSQLSNYTVNPADYYGSIRGKIGYCLRQGISFMGNKAENNSERVLVVALTTLTILGGVYYVIRAFTTKKIVSLNNK